MTKTFTLTDPAEVADTPAIAPEKPTITDEPTSSSTLYIADPDPKARTQPRAFYMASQWHIMPGEEPGTMEATNNTTGDRFVGTFADFNSMLRGD